MNESAAAGRKLVSVSYDLLSTCRPEVEDRAKQRSTGARRRQTIRTVLCGPQQLASSPRTCWEDDADRYRLGDNLEDETC